MTDEEEDCKETRPITMVFPRDGRDTLMRTRASVGEYIEYTLRESREGGK